MAFSKNVQWYVKEVITQQRRGPVSNFIRILLLPMSWMYGLVIRLRQYLYDKGWMRCYVPPVPLVISIGNIVAGGTGKTPVTLLLAQSFYDRIPLAILSRGYRSKAEKLDLPILLSEGDGPTFPASDCGDEPYLLAKRLPRSIVVVGGNRKKSSFLAAKAGAQIILLDDGMQHLRLARDFDVVVVDVGDPFGHGYLLPRGFLREDVRALGRADLLVLNHIQEQEQFDQVKGQLSQYTSAPMVGVNGRVSAIRNLSGEEVILQQGQRVALFCAIAHPEYFKRTLEKEGLQVVNEYPLADHDTIRERELEQFAKTSAKRGAQWLVCTEKDRVKLRDKLVLSLPIAWVQFDLSVVAGQEAWEQFLRCAESKVNHLLQEKGS